MINSSKTLCWCVCIDTEHRNCKVGHCTKSFYEKQRQWFLSTIEKITEDNCY